MIIYFAFILTHILFLFVPSTRNSYMCQSIAVTFIFMLIFALSVISLLILYSRAHLILDVHMRRIGY